MPPPFGSRRHLLALALTIALVCLTVGISLATLWGVVVALPHGPFAVAAAVAVVALGLALGTALTVVGDRFIQRVYFGGPSGRA